MDDCPRIIHKSKAWRPNSEGVLLSGGEISYSDNSELYLKNVFSQVSDLSSNSLQLGQYIKDWPSLYHLSRQRPNFLRPLGLPQGAQVLEIGAGCGAITRWLGENFKRVDAVEGNKERALLAKKRCRDLDNVAIYCANIKDLSFRPQYDIVLLTGVLEYAPRFMGIEDPHEACLSMLTKAASALRKEGLLLLCIENRLGLKYWSGCQEDHTGRPFESLYNYPHREGILTFSRQELRAILQEAGFRHVELVGLFPDYKLTEVMVRDTEGLENYFPHNWLSYPFPDRNRNGKRPHIFFEPLVSKSLVRSGLFMEFANSFLAIASKDGELQLPSWIICKIRNFDQQRLELDHLTMLIKDGTKAIVRRRPLVSDSKEYRLGNLVLRIQDEEFIPGDLLLFHFFEKMVTIGWKRALVETLQRLRSFLVNNFSLAGNHLPPHTFDVTLWNTIIHKNQLKVIDRKWEATKPLSVDFILFRNVFHIYQRFHEYFPPMSQKDFCLKILREIFPKYHEENFKIHKQEEVNFLKAIPAVLNPIIIRPDKPLVSIIIPVYNKLEYTKQCLNALLETIEVGKTEIIIVDNASTDDTPKWLHDFSKKWPHIKVLRQKENLGFAKACNIGAKIARGKYLLFLNNDTVPLRDWLDELLQAIESDNRIGIVGSKLLFPDNTIQHAGVAIANTPNRISPFHIFYKKPSNYSPANIKRYLQVVTGACMLVKKDLFQELGGFDETFINGYEDVDFCLRAVEKGYKVLYNPKSVLYHYESVTPGRFDHVSHNEKRLREKWLGKIKYDIRVDLPKVAIVIVNFKNYNDLTECIDSLNQLEYDAYDIVIVDNTEDTSYQEWITKHAGHLTMYKNTTHELNFTGSIIYIKNATNDGFAAAVNKGIRLAIASEADYVWILNPDTVVDPRALWELVNIAVSDKKIGIVTSAVFSYYEPDKLQYFGMGVDYDGKSMDVNTLKPYAAETLTGCSMLINLRMVKEIGFLNEDYFLYFEENDLFERAKSRRWKAIFQPSSKVYHKGGASIGKWLTTPLSVYYAVRNLLLFTEKFYPERFASIIDTIEMVFWPSVRQKSILVEAFGKALRDFLRNKKGNSFNEQSSTGRFLPYKFRSLGDQFNKTFSELIRNPSIEVLDKLMAIFLLAYRTKQQERTKKLQRLCQKAENLHQKGKSDRALRILHKIIEIHPFARAYSDLAVIYWEKDDVTNALKYIEEALKLAPDDKDIIWNCGQIMLGLGRPNEAYEVYKGYLQKHPGEQEFEQAVLQIESMLQDKQHSCAN